MGPMTWGEERPSAKDTLVGGTFLWLSSIQGARSWKCDQVGAPRSASLYALWPGAGFPERAVWIHDCLEKALEVRPPQRGSICLRLPWVAGLPAPGAPCGHLLNTHNSTSREIRSSPAFWYGKL